MMRAATAPGDSLQRVDPRLAEGRSQLFRQSLVVLAVAMFAVGVLDGLIVQRADLIVVGIFVSIVLLGLLLIYGQRPRLAAIGAYAVICAASVLFVLLRPDIGWLGVFGVLLAYLIVITLLEQSELPRMFWSGLAMVLLHAAIVLMRALGPGGRIGDVYIMFITTVAVIAIMDRIRIQHSWLNELISRNVLVSDQLQRLNESLEAQVQARTHELAAQNLSLAAARDEAERLGKIKTNFLATMSHELRTPMNGILGMSELLLTSGLNAEQEDLARVVHESGQGLMVLLNDILDISRIEAGHVRLNLAEVNPLPIMQDVTRLLEAGAQQKGITLSSTSVLTGRERVIADPSRLRQVLTNLMGNAVKFTRAGGVSCTLSRDAMQGMLRIEVADTGIGVPAHLRSQLFTPFFQADASRTRTEGGAGLGLAITRDLITRMGGQIGHTENPDGGSVFWFTLREYVAA
jgi:signal transduction histidine kinase